MEEKFKTSFNGQEVQEGDLNTIADNAAMADDRVLAELFRMPFFNGGAISKGILPFSGGPTVNLGTGAVSVFPFRFLVGSIVSAAMDTEENWRGIRSGISINASTVINTLVPIANGDATFSRWDLVYVRMARENPSSSVTRYIKSPTTPFTVTPTTLVTTVTNPCTLLITQGVASGAPALPSLPSDTASFYYAPLAYIRVPPGFISSTPVVSTNIFDTAPVLNLSTVTGSTTCVPASAMFDPNGPVLSKTPSGVEDWGFTGTRVREFFPPTMKGEETIYFSMDLSGVSTSTAWSQPDGSIIDNSRDWRNRLFTWSVFGRAASVNYVWEPSATDDGTSIPSARFTAPINDTTSNAAYGFGQSIKHTDLLSSGRALVILLDNNIIGGTITSPNTLFIYVDQGDGTLRFTTNFTFPNCRLFVRLTATSPFYNV